VPYSGSLLHSGSVRRPIYPIGAHTGSKDAVTPFCVVMIECGASHMFRGCAQWVDGRMLYPDARRNSHLGKNREEHDGLLL